MLYTVTGLMTCRNEGARVYLRVSTPYPTKEDNFLDLLFTFLDDVALLNRSAIKGKNLLLEEQILSFKS